MAGTTFRKISAWGLGAGLGLGLVAGAFAQEQQEDTGRYKLTVSQGIKWSDNPSFLSAGSDSALLGTSQLEFGLTQGNRQNQFTLTAGAGVEYELDGSNSRWLDPNLALNYVRDSRDMRLELNASGTRNRLSDLNLSDGFDEDDLQTGDSTRDDLQFRASLQTGRTARFGTQWTISRNQRDYSDDGSYNDTSTDRYEGILRFDWNRLASSRLSFSRREYQTDSSEVSDKDTTTFGLNNSFQINKVTELDLGLRYSKIEEETREFDGFSYSADLTIDRPNGELTLSFDSSYNETGRRENLRLGRTMDQKWGSIGGSIGVSRNDDGDLQPLYTLSLTRNAKTARFTANLNQQIAVSNADQDVLRTQLSLAYQQEINSRSSFDARLGLADSRNLDNDDDTSRLNGSLTYRHQVGADWGLAAGVSHTTAFSDTGSDTERNEVFMRLEKDFDWR